MLFKFVVCETRDSMVWYTVEADSLEQATQKAYEGNVIDREEYDRGEVIHREVFKQVGQ